VNDMKAFRLEDGFKDCISVWIKKRAGFIQDTKDIQTKYGKALAFLQPTRILTSSYLMDPEWFRIFIKMRSSWVRVPG
jgi:hypothetical protein